MKIEVSHYRGMPTVGWAQVQPLIEAERVVENFSIVAIPGVIFYVWAALYNMEFPPFWVLLLFLFLGFIPGGIILLIAMPILRNARYAKLAGKKVTPRKIPAEKMNVMGVETYVIVNLLPSDKDKFSLYYTIPAFIIYARGNYEDKFRSVDADTVVDFTVQDGAAWTNIQGISFSVIVMRLNDGNSAIVALHYGNQGEMFALQQTLTREFITNRPRGGWAGQKQAAQAAQRRIDDDTI